MILERVLKNWFGIQSIFQIFMIFSIFQLPKIIKYIYIYIYMLNLAMKFLQLQWWSFLGPSSLARDAAKTMAYPRARCLGHDNLA